MAELPLELQLLSMESGAAAGHALAFAEVHRWLGLMWSADLSLERLLKERFAMAAASMAELVGLVNCRALSQPPSAQSAMHM